MDPLAHFLDGPRARGAFLLRSVMDPPWSLRIEDEAPLTVLALVRGAAWIVPPAGAVQLHAGAVQLHAGDVALVRGPSPYVVADRPDTAPQIRIGPGQVCYDDFGNRMAEQLSLGVRTWGNSAGGATVMLTGTYQAGEVSGRLLSSLPELIVLADDEWDSPVVSLLAAEVGRDAPGQEAVLDRLLDLLVVSTLRYWFDRPETTAPRWYAAYADPVVGRAIRLLQNNPAHPWTVASVAAAAGVSRAALARRFAELVGESPIAFLTSWRLALAADLLADADVTVARVARQVGYGSPFTFSTAFKRRYGLSPQQYRRRDAATATA